MGNNNPKDLLTMVPSDTNNYGLKEKDNPNEKTTQPTTPSISYPTPTLSTPNTISQLTTNTPIEAIMSMLNNRLEIAIEPKP